MPEWRRFSDYDNDNDNDKCDDENADENDKDWVRVSICRH